MTGSRAAVSTTIGTRPQSSSVYLCYDHHVNVYNTLSGTVETIEPSGRAITLYVCGITPYDTTHLGHAFTYTVADVFVRHLESRGLTVRYVQNVTDIDDDILRTGAPSAIAGPRTSSATCRS